jgi:basic amino acid/polyamine antiporter, APA family
VSEAPQLKRELGLASAVWIGLGSMIGAGVFAAFSPAAQAAGNGLLVGLAVAGLVAFCNAASSAQLAAVYPQAGGTYVFGRERLGPWWGFVAGWSFVIGKTASCAAMALTFAAYAAPPGWERPIAVAAVVALVAVNLLGVTRTAQATRAIVVVVLLVLAIVVAAGLSTGLPAFMDAAATTTTSDPATAPFADSLIASGPYAILQSAGLLFFAFAGFARIATMGEEVREPAVTIPRAILAALGITVIVYATIAVIVLGTLGAEGTAASSAPLAATAAAAGWSWADPIVRVGAAAASLGALLALLAGIGRTSLAMARERDLPGWFAAVHPRFSVPYRAEIVLGLAVCALVATVDLRGAIGFSSFGVLLYYFIANLSAFTQPAAQRRYPRAVGVIGMLGCLTLVVTLPFVAIVVGVGVVLVGVGYRALVRRAPNSSQAA